MSTEILHKATKKTLVPELRFPEFEEEWKGMKLGKLGTFLGGGTPNTSNEYYWKGNTPWISSSDIFEDDLHSINISRYLTDIAIKESATKIIPKNSILLVSRVGVGKLAINKIDLCTSQDFSNFIPSNDNSFFIGYYLIFKKNILINFSQGTSIKGFTTNDVKTLSINIPSLPEQQKIASFLSAVDEKTQQLIRKKELLEQYKKGVMQQLFSGELRFKNDKGKDFPEWEKKKLGEVLKIGSGKDYKHLSEGNIPVFGTGGYMLSVNKYLHKGETVFIGRKGTIDKPFYFSGEFWTVDTLFYTHSFKKAFPKFIYYVFQQINWKLHNEASGVPSLSKSTIEKLKFDFPCLEEQQKIADFLSSIDVKIENVNQQLNQAQNFKKGLLQQLFV